MSTYRTLLRKAVAMIQDEEPKPDYRIGCWRLLDIRIQTVLLPDDAQIVSAAMCDSQLCLFALVETSQLTDGHAVGEQRIIEIIKTGERIAMPEHIHRAFIGTVIDGPNQYHVFQRTDLHA